MVVDDQIDNLMLLEIIIQSMGHRFVGVQDPTTLYHHLQQTPPDLLMVDLALPGKLDGLEIAQQLRTEGYTTLPIIAMTATARYDESLALKAGCDAFIERPSALSAVKQLIARFLG